MREMVHNPVIASVVPLVWVLLLAADAGTICEPDS
jgi:hypothetical protein